jgi:sarcosine oxidase subunit beta
VRCHYGVPSLAAMAWKGLLLFESAADRLGADVGFRRSGYLVGVGGDDVAALAANVAMLRGLGVETSVVGGDAAAELWPWASLDGLAAFAYEPRGGYGDAYLACQAFAAAARRAGVRIRQRAPVRSLTGRGGRVVGVELADGERVAAGTVVLAAGWWSAALAAPLGVEIPLRAQHEVLLVVDPGRPLGPVPVLSDLVSLQYVRPDSGGRLLVGNSDHGAPVYADPDNFSARPDPPRLAAAAAKIDARFPGLPGAALVSTYAGCYDVTPDYNPVIGPAPVPGLVLCAGFSGHGFKISPAVGELVADLVLAGENRDPAVAAADFRFGRFAEGAPLASRHPYTGAAQMR